jgi:kynurenine formamidase
MTTIYHDLTLPLSPEIIVVPADRPPEFEESKTAMAAQLGSY